MLESGFLSVGPIAIGNINPNHGHEDFQNLVWPNDYSQIARKRLMSGRATDRDPKVNPRFEVLMIAQSANSANADVVRIFDGSNQTATIKGHVKLSRQVVELTVVDDELSQF